MRPFPLIIKGYYMVDKYELLSEDIKNLSNHIRYVTTQSVDMESANMNQILDITEQVFVKSKKLKKLENQLSELINNIDALKSEIQRLSSARDELEGRNGDKTVYIFPNYPIYPTYDNPYDWKPYYTYSSGHCSVCGIDWSGAMGYCCSNKDCPTAIKSTCDSL